MLSVKIYKKLPHLIIDKEWSVLPGEIIALFGPSGSGKTMTIKTISGLEIPDSGTIILNENTLYDSENKINQPPQKRKVGYLPQNYALFPHMTLYENIIYGLKSKNENSIKEAIELLNRMDLEKYKNQYPDNLSGGQQQRAALIRAILTKPEVLLLDEPFSSVDAFLRKKLRQEIKVFLNETNLPIVIVTHDPFDIEDLGARVVNY